MDKKAFQDKVEKIKAKVSELTDEQIEAHVAKVAAIYSKRRTASLLGDFSEDSEHVYYWHTYDDNPHKLARRMELGWGFANRDDARMGGLTEALISDVTIDGDTCVEMSHKNSRAVLLKIPKVLDEANTRVKEQLKRNRPVFDVNGKIVRTEVISATSDKIVNKRIESTTTFG